MNIQDYIDKLNIRYKSGITTEHSYRGDLQNLLEHILPTLLVTNEPTRIKCGAPDYILTKNEIPIGYIEAKDLGADLNSKSYAGQFKRYRDALSNLVITNYLDFQVYKEGTLITTYSLGEIKGNNVVSNTTQYSAFTAFLRDFSTVPGQTIKSPLKLATMMANKAKMLALVIEAALQSDEDSQENSSLKEQMKAFQDILIHDITAKGFADLYAQTISYGMFAARLYDPIIHFYETFLAEYDPALRKARGVWYTPEPVVKFIVRAVDDILKSEFSLPDGLADRSTIKRKVKVPTHDKRFSGGMVEVDKTYAKVQILDPATGTGTFLAEVIKHIYVNKFKGQQGVGSSYVENHLIPRLNGFELLMASYAMAHLKLDLLLTETGYKTTKSQRLRVFLTNSLEEHHPDTGTLFASWLSN